MDRAITTEAVVAAVREQYQRFPYPPVSSIEEEAPEQSLTKSFNLDLGLTGERALASGSRIWVPGCGTRWAVMVALQFRDVEILATDLSERAIAVQRELARALGLDNIEFRCEDMTEVRYEAEFDFVSCVGVLHHLPSPARGFEVLSRALKPTGIVELMVYDRWNRHHSMRAQEILSALDPERTLEAAERFELVCRVLRSANHLASAPPELKRVLKYLDAEPAFAQELADFVSHPQEHYFDVPELLRALGRVKLSPRAWKNAHLFDPAKILEDERLRRAIESMPTERRAHLGHVLSNGLLELFAEPVGNPNASSSEPQLRDIRERVVHASTRGVRHHIDPGGGVLASEGYAKVDLGGERAHFDGGERRPGVSYYGIAFDCVKPGRRRAYELDAEHALIEEITRVAEQPIAIGDLAAKLSYGRTYDMTEQDTVLLCDKLCRTPFRILLSL